jgi:threonine/homoserine/homoserine lactone efflux protein
MEEKTPEAATEARLFGYVLTTLAVIVLPLCGLCTYAFLRSAGPVGTVAIELPLIFGGLPMAGAAFALWWGIRLIRNNPKTPKPPHGGQP